MSTYEVDFHCQTVYVDIKLSGFSAPAVAAVSRDTWKPYLSFAANTLLRLVHVTICDTQNLLNQEVMLCMLSNQVHGHSTVNMIAIPWMHPIFTPIFILEP